MSTFDGVSQAFTGPKQLLRRPDVTLGGHREPILDRGVRLQMSQADRRTFWITVAALILGVATCLATEIPRADGPISIDGNLDDEGWQDAKVLRLIQLEPVVGANPTEPSEVLLAHDGEALYAAARFGDSEPSLIRANGLRRDEMNGDDLFGLVIDSFNDDESALAFYTNPAGTRIDEAISNDAEWSGSSPFNRNWNTFWDSAARRTPRAGRPRSGFRSLPCASSPKTDGW